MGFACGDHRKRYKYHNESGTKRVRSTITLIVCQVSRELYGISLLPGVMKRGSRAFYVGRTRKLWGFPTRHKDKIARPLSHLHFPISCICIVPFFT